MLIEEIMIGKHKRREKCEGDNKCRKTNGTKHEYFASTDYNEA